MFLLPKRPCPHCRSIHWHRARLRTRQDYVLKFVGINRKRCNTCINYFYLWLR